MKLIWLAYCLCSCLLPAAAARAQTTASSEWLLSGDQVGPLRLGAPVADVYRIFGRENIRLVDLQLEGHYTPALEIRVPPSFGSASIVARISSARCGDVILSATVTDRRYRTREGVGVGSTVEEISRVYRVRLSNEEGQHLLSATPQMAFNSFDDLRRPSASVDAVYIHTTPAAACPR